MVFIYKHVLKRGILQMILLMRTKIFKKKTHAHRLYKVISFQFANDQSLGGLQKDELQWLPDSKTKRANVTGALTYDRKNVTLTSQCL